MANKWIVVVHRYDKPTDHYGVHIVTKRDWQPDEERESQFSPRLREARRLTYSYSNTVVGLYDKESYKLILNMIEKLSTTDRPHIAVGELREYIKAQVIPLEWKSNDDNLKRVAVYAI